MHYTLEPIGYIQSPFKQKFAIPRQSGLVTQAKARLTLVAPYSSREALRGLQDFSHVWLTFIFHENREKGWSNLVRPPRLGGNKKQGVFATRSSFRPNSIGLSAVKLLDVVTEHNNNYLTLGGIDLLDGTPILDIKPYLPYSDSITDAYGGFAQEKPSQDMPVVFSKQAQAQCKKVATKYPQLAELISQLLLQDPRPAYKKNNQESQDYAMLLYDFNITWRVENSTNYLLSIDKIKP